MHSIWVGIKDLVICDIRIWNGHHYFLSNVIRNIYRFNKSFNFDIQRGVEELNLGINLLTPHLNNRGNFTNQNKIVCLVSINPIVQKPIQSIIGRSHAISSWVRFSVFTESLIVSILQIELFSNIITYISETSSLIVQCHGNVWISTNCKGMFWVFLRNNHIISSISNSYNLEGIEFIRI